MTAKVMVEIICLIQANFMAFYHFIGYSYLYTVFLLFFSCYRFFIDCIFPAIAFSLILLLLLFISISE